MSLIHDCLYQSLAGAYSSRVLTQFGHQAALCKTDKSPPQPISNVKTTFFDNIFYVTNINFICTGTSTGSGENKWGVNTIV